MSEFKYCQSQIEGNGKCNKQCEHCIVYYKPLEDEKIKERLIKELTDFLVKKNKKLDVNLFCNAHELAEEFGNIFLPENKKNSLCQIYDERDKCADYRNVSNSCISCNFFKDPFK